MNTIAAVKRYELRRTPSTRYLLVPAADYRALFGDDPDASLRLWSLAGLQGRRLCAWLEAAYAMPRFLRRARRQGWDCDWLAVQMAAEPWEDA